MTQERKQLDITEKPSVYKHPKTYADKNKAIEKSIKHSTNDARYIHREAKESVK